MKYQKGSSSNQTTSGRDNASGYSAVSHRQSASSVGTSLKLRSGAAASATNANEGTSGGAGNQERTGYHQSGATKASGQASKVTTYKGSANAVGSSSVASASAASGSIQERKCDSCKYRTPINQCTTFRCRNCGTYVVSKQISGVV